MDAAAEHADAFLVAALGYRAEFLWSIVPVCTATSSAHCLQHGLCESPGKVPLVAWRDWQDEPAPESTLRYWWSRWPHANVGLITGVVSGVAVIDLDGDIAQREAEQRGWPDPGPVVTTGRVGGLHIYCAWRSDAPSVFNRRGGIDFKGQGGYVVLPPSVHWNGNTYRWQHDEPPSRGEPLPPLPRWINTLAMEPPDRTDGLSVPLDIRGMPQGMRNDSLARLIGQLRYYEHVSQEQANQVALEYARGCRPPLSEREALNVVKSIFRYPEHEGPAPPQLHHILPKQWVQEPLPGFEVAAKLIRIEDMSEQKVEQAAEVVGGMMWAGRVHWWYSGPAAGKTIFTCAMLMHIAAGLPFLGRPVEQGPVIMLQEDTSPSAMLDYIEMLAALYELDLHGLPVYFNRHRGMRLKSKQDYDEVLATIKELNDKPKLIVFDACERFVPSKDFNTAELEWLGRILAWCSGEGIATCVIDHTRKHAEEGGDPIDELYGGRAKSAISDVMWRITGSIKDEATFECVKFRGEYPPKFRASFDGIEGFKLKTERIAITPNEQAVQRVLNNTRNEWIGVSEISALLQQPMHLRTLQRTLERLITRGWIEAEGAARATVYRAASSNLTWQ